MRRRWERYQKRAQQQQSSTDPTHDCGF